MTILGRLLLVLCITLAAPVVAQNDGEPAPAVVEVEPTPEERIAELERRNDELRYGLDIARIHNDLVDRQTSWFSILISGFAFVVSGVVIFFAFRFGKEAKDAAVEAATKLAKAEAVSAATSSIEDERKQLEALLQRAEDDFAKFAPMLVQARSSLAEIEKEEERARKLGQLLKPGEAPDDPQIKDEVEEVAGTADGKREKERTSGDYRALITRAVIKKDWSEVEKRARAMLAVVEEKDDASQTAFALFSIARAQARQDQKEQAIETYDKLIDQYSESDDPALLTEVAKALVNKGADLGALDRSEDAIAAYDEVVKRFGKSHEPALQEQVANAIFNKGFRLGELDRAEEEIAAYDEVARRFGKSDQPEIKAAVASALFNKACVFALQSNPSSATSALSEWAEHVGKFDCAKVRREDNFDEIRDDESFVKLMETNGCDCGPLAPEASVEADPDVPEPKVRDEAAGPDHE